MSIATSPPRTAEPGLLACAAIAAVLQGAILLGDSFRTDAAMTVDGWSIYLAYKADQLLRALLTLPIFAFSLQAIERLPWTGARRLAATVALAVGCALLSSALMVSLPYPPVAIRVGTTASVETWFWYTLWANFVVVVLAVLALGHLRERRQAVERLAQAQDQGRAVRQQLARAQLQQIQARVDPQLLFDTLGAVKAFYQDEADRAERLLDELATFLRAALPGLRSTRSTLELEFELVACYTRLLRIAFDRQVRLTLKLPPGLANQGFPAGLLLPLSIQLLEGGADRRIELSATADERHLRVAIMLDAAPSDAPLEWLTAALSDLYGGGAGCRWTTGPAQPGARCATLELETPRDPS